LAQRRSERKYFTKRLFLRASLILITFPLIFTLLFVLPYQNFLALNLTILSATFIGALEVRNLLERQFLATSRFLAPILGATLPVSAYLTVAGVVERDLIPGWLAIVLAVLLVRGIIVQRKKQLPEILTRVSSSFLIVCYPGLFLAFVSLMTGWKEASYKILFFLSLVFTNDIVAYLAGNLIGKRGNFIISPNKSMAGFVAGFISSIVVSWIFYLLLPQLFPTCLIAMLIFGAAIGATTILGDLVESAFKRSADVKDSGTIMIGRGGLLDSLDSMLISAPVFFIFFQYILR
jgi:phosphatidate cytidylyltransferase